MLRALRPQQWVKNLLVFLPLVTSHQLFVAEPATAAGLAFVCFCLCASAMYLLNDLLDLSADRRHPIKRNRPLASGRLSGGLAIAAALVLLAVAATIAKLTLPGGFSTALAAYVAASCLYSWRAKRIAILDVLLLAGLYTIRVVAGGEAAGIRVSEWLLAFSMFLFLSLAFAKRYAELKRLAGEGLATAAGRGYQVADLGIVETMGTVSGYLSVLVLALYTNSEPMRKLYSNPWPLWLLCAVLLYWISRLWIKARRGELAEDPILYAFRDPASLLSGLIAAGLVAAAAML